MSGGTGASTFAVNLAWELATIDKDPPRVCLLDLDFQYGSVSTYLDLPRKEAIFEILTDPGSADADSFVKSMQTFNEKLHVFTAPADMLPLEFVNSDNINRVLDIARANFDCVIIDMPSTIVQWTEAVLNHAHVYFALLELARGHIVHGFFEHYFDRPRLVRAKPALNLIVTVRAPARDAKRHAAAIVVPPRGPTAV